MIRVRGFPERDICSLPGMGSGLGSRRKCCWRAAAVVVVGGGIWGLGHFKKIRNVVFSENKKCCLQSEQRELIQCYSNLKKKGTPKRGIWLVITITKSCVVENIKLSHGPYGHFGCGTLANTCKIFHFFMKIWKSEIYCGVFCYILLHS